MRPWYKKKRLIVPLALFALIAVIQVGIGGSEDDPIAALPAASTSSPASTASESASSEPSEEPTTEAPADDPTTEQPTEDPTDEAPAEPSTTLPKKRTYTGSGDDVIKFKEAITDPVLVTTKWTGADDNNTIYAYDADGNEGDLLVNTIGAYNGTAITNISVDSSLKALKIEGSGNWKITLKPITDARAWDGEGTLKGSSDDVVNVVDVFNTLDEMRFKSTGADGNISVYGLGESQDLIVNEIGNFSGDYLVPPGTTLLQIESDGRWEIKKK
jgi:hypothetical protein